jgi:hypothetical protein
MEVLSVLAMGFVCVTCFLAGAKLGQTVTKGEEIKIPSVNPMQDVREYKAKKEAEMELDKFNKILQNIDKYDGTPKGQEDVP